MRYFPMILHVCAFCDLLAMPCKGDGFDRFPVARRNSFLTRDFSGLLSLILRILGELGRQNLKANHQLS